MEIKTVWAVYFSGTGTTQKVATTLAKSLAQSLEAGYQEYCFNLPAAREKALSFTPEDLVVLAVPAFAAGSDDAANNDSTVVTTSVNDQAAATSTNSGSSQKSLASGIAIGLAAAGGAIAIGMAVAKSVEGIARQPEAESKIRTTLMLGLVFIETAIIYALLVVILIIFVL